MSFFLSFSPPFFLFFWRALFSPFLSSWPCGIEHSPAYFVCQSQVSTSLRESVMIHPMIRSDLSRLYMHADANAADAFSGSTLSITRLYSICTISLFYLTPPSLNRQALHLTKRCCRVAQCRIMLVVPARITQMQHPKCPIGSHLQRRSLPRRNPFRRLVGRGRCARPYHRIHCRRCLGCQSAVAANKNLLWGSYFG